jgi:hypothetical protein
VLNSFIFDDDINNQNSLCVSGGSTTNPCSNSNTQTQTNFGNNAGGQQNFGGGGSGGGGGGNSLDQGINQGQSNNQNSLCVIDTFASNSCNNANIKSTSLNIPIIKSPLLILFDLRKHQ